MPGIAAAHARLGRLEKAFALRIRPPLVIFHPGDRRRGERQPDPLPVNVLGVQPSQKILAAVRPLLIAGLHDREAVAHVRLVELPLRSTWRTGDADVRQHVGLVFAEPDERTGGSVDEDHPAILKGRVVSGVVPAGHTRRGDAPLPLTPLVLSETAPLPALFRPGLCYFVLPRRRL